MTKDVIALTERMPDVLSILAGLLAGGPDLRVVSGVTAVPVPAAAQPAVDMLTDQLGTVLRDSSGAPKMYGPSSNHPGLVKSKNNIDPLTGTTVDGVTGGSHRVGAFATRFDNAEDMVRADAYFRDETARTDGDVDRGRARARSSGKVHGLLSQPGQCERIQAGRH
ncbi:hypothetical protein [Streptomyces sp. DT9]